VRPPEKLASFHRFISLSGDTERRTGLDNAAGETASVCGVRAFCAFCLSSRRERMRLEPERAGSGCRIDANLLPPCCFVPTAMDIAMMAAAQRSVNSSLTFRPSARCCAKRKCCGSEGERPQSCLVTNLTCSDRECDAAQDG
jgi:hypothetical protein